MGGLCRQVAYVQKYRQRCGHSCKDTDKPRGIQVEIQTQVEEGGERHDIRAVGPERLSLSLTQLHHLVYHCNTTNTYQY